MKIGSGRAKSNRRESLAGRQVHWDGRRGRQVQLGGLVDDCAGYVCATAGGRGVDPGLVFAAAVGGTAGLKLLRDRPGRFGTGFGVDVAYGRDRHVHPLRF